MAADLDHRPAKSRTGFPRLVLFVGALLCASLVSLYLGQDANWDLQNYHFYNPYAFINDRIDWDIAPAQLQSYHNPLADIPFYWAVRADLPPQSIAILLALPAGVAWFFLFLSLERLFGSSGLRRSRAYVPLGLLIGVTGTAGVSLIGTTTNDWPGAMLVVIAIWLLLISSLMAQTKKMALISLAGLLAGFAAGLKLTSAPYAAALCLALLLTVRPFRYHAIACAAAFSSLTLVGFFATSGFWLWRMYEKFGNPIFPYFNQWFRSPWWDAIPLESGYGPQSLAEWAVFPFRLFRYNTGIVGELAFRDWRIPFVFAAAALALAAFGLKKILTGYAAGYPRPTWEWRFVAVFWFLSFVFWTAEHSVYRYIVPLELFSGAMAIIFFCSPLPAPWRFAGALVITGLVIAKTLYPVTLRVPFGQHFFAVSSPELPSDALVLLVEDAPLAYVVPFMDVDARFVGARNNLNAPSGDHLLAKEISQVIEQHSGPLFSMQSSKGLGDDALSAYGLRKRSDQCAVIDTNMTMGPIKLCELTRSTGP